MSATRKNLVKEADRIFSLYVRNRGARWGYNYCYTCGAYLPVGELQAGHFINRRFINVRWHILNVWPQCNRCNVELGGNLRVYKKKLIDQFSEDALDGLYMVARENTGGLTDEEIKDIIKKYK